jgi:signal transduction histidine kinase
VHLYADPALITRVIDNVVANAVHYNRDGGTVHVSARVREPESDAWVTPLVIVEISDTGPGIPPEEQERIFTRFHRLDQSRARHTGGSGLGLAICREVLGLLGGSIRVARSDGSGTTLELQIPGAMLPVATHV